MTDENGERNSKQALAERKVSRLQHQLAFKAFVQEARRMVGYALALTAT